MPESDHIEILLKDPLSEITRKERRSLLGVSAIGIAMVKTGLVPTKIPAFGIEFSQTNKLSFFIVLAAIVFYFLLAFLVYAIPDFLAWRMKYQNLHESSKKLKKSFLVMRLHNSLSSSSAEQPSQEASGDLEGWTPILPPEKESKQKDLENEISQTEQIITDASWTRRVSIPRVIFEFLVPILIAIYAIRCLLSSIPPP